MGSYVSNDLGPGETVVYEAHLHWMIYFGPATSCGVGLALLVDGLPIEGLGILAVAAAWFLAAWIRQTSSEFAVTNKRVIIKVGWLSRRTIEINMSRVESIQVDQAVIARLLNYGTITVVGTGGTHEPFSLIDDPLAFRRAVQTEQG
jgi:uncharacterized membrane protein YdbT with pleckstrin-like domain